MASWLNHADDSYLSFAVIQPSQPSYAHACVHTVHTYASTHTLPCVATYPPGLHA